MCYHVCITFRDTFFFVFILFVFTPLQCSFFQYQTETRVESSNRWAHLLLLLPLRLILTMVFVQKTGREKDGWARRKDGAEKTMDSERRGENQGRGIKYLKI